jgi:aminoglycoside/choline kinase family phosphotransferase
VTRSDSEIEISALGDFLSSLGIDAVVKGVDKLAGDGSTRSYHRVMLGGGSVVLMDGPDAAENGGFLRIAAHLEKSGVRVPKVLGHSGERGWILLEDLGNVNLLDLVLECESDGERLALLTPVLEVLCRMGVDGTEDFLLDTGFSDSHYDAALMVKWEGLYFLREFVTGVLDVEFDRAEIEAEIIGLAHRAQELTGGGQGEFFLHRDFQSRNVMQTEGEWVVIDFQGARPGPLAYDAASFIFDPYMANSLAVREELVSRYRALLAACPGVEVEVFDRSLGPVGAFRIMQALGAYGKLGHRFGKPGFLEHSGVALEHLEWFLLRCGEGGGTPKLEGLLQLVGQCRRRWSEREG